MAWIDYRKLQNSSHYRPYVEIWVSDPLVGDPSRYRKCLCILDTGADRSALPESVIAEMDLVQTGITDVGVFGGGRISTNTYSAILTVFGREFRMEKMVGESGRLGTIGRDLLNEFFLMVDGPKRRFAVLSRLLSFFGRMLGRL